MQTQQQQQNHLNFWNIAIYFPYKFFYNYVLS